MNRVMAEIVQSFKHALAEVSPKITVEKVIHFFGGVSGNNN
jgi:hypothetical protein